MGLKERLINQKKVAAQKSVLYSRMDANKSSGLSQKLKISRTVPYSKEK
ncbi:MAG: hypothetical protein ACRCY4_07920 [Brevinema sp.]